MTRFRPLPATILLAGLICLGTPSTMSAPAAAREGPDIPTIGPEPGQTGEKAVRQLQMSLATLGLYSGTIDGRMNNNLASAIRLYQQQAGLKIDGRVSDALVAHVERSVSVSRVLRELNAVRGQTMDAARQALASHPATRDLVEGHEVEPADPTRDAKPCFDKPTVRCLLAEAYESAKAVTKRDLRDWVFGEILAAQARAGLTGEAMETTRRIQDPRLIMVALRDIATAQARAGRGQEALAAAEVIPESHTQIEAIAQIAETQARHGYRDAARDTATLLYHMARHQRKAADQITFATKAAVTLHRTGDATTAEAALNLARAAAASDDSVRGKESAWRQVAAALAELDRLDAARDAAERVAHQSDRAAVLIALAQSAIRAGKADLALKMAKEIEAERYRVLVLAEVAVAKARDGDWAAADHIVEQAFSDAEEVRLPFARSYAISRLVLALSDMAGIKGKGPDGVTLAARFARAGKAADGINDARLRAQVLFEIASQQRRTGLPAEAVAESERKALNAAAQIPSPISRVWVYGDMATQRARAADDKGAWADFDRGMAEARKIDNAWGRSRAMVKMAQTLIDLVAPQTAPAEQEMSPEKP